LYLNVQEPKRVPNWKRLAAALIFSAILIAGCQQASAPTGPEPSNHSQKQPTIVFMTDFGTANDAVAICKAVMLGIAPDARIMDITHQVTPFSIADGARFLAGVTPYYPQGTVFVVVIDPGVGTARKAVIVKTKKEQFFVLPDNGLITPVADRDGVEGVREITNPAWMIGDKVSSTFHGRDIFSPAGAHLANGEDWNAAGPEVAQLVRLTPPSAAADAKGISGLVIALDDPFGNLITNVPSADFQALGYARGDKVAIQLNGKPFVFPYGKTFSDVPVGQPLVYIDSRGRVAIAINQGDFSAKYKITPPVQIFISKKS
jgi:S-adenosylmethionine hydrolase